MLLADGTRFVGTGLSTVGSALGEAVFFTGMTGYEEALTDPSYAGQILTFTYPMIGNYGVSYDVAQYPRACVAGAVIKALAQHPSHHACKTRLGDWLDAEGIPTIVGIDTRTLTIALREHGTLGAALAVGPAAIATAETDLARYVRDATTKGLVESVAVRSAAAARRPHDGGKHIVLIDCGVKHAIVRDLEALNVNVTVLPYNASRDQINAYDPDGIVISPGPGDPADLAGMIVTLRSLLGERPMFGVCLGHQMLALACGAHTYKLKYGHRGGNQPVKDLRTMGVLVTAHNHGYAVDGASLPAELEATMINLNDGTNEGFRHRMLPVSGVQFHPEASPGPFDARYLFAQWLESLPSEGAGTRSARP